MNKNNISWLWIVLGFIFVWPVGLVLLMVKLFGGNTAVRPRRNYNTPNFNRTYQPPSQTQRTPYQQQDWRQNAQTVQSQTVDQPAAEAQPETQAPPRPQHRQRSYNQQQAAPPPTYNYGYNYNYNKNSERAMERNEERLRRKIALNKGQGLRIAGWIIVGMGALSAGIAFLGMMFDGGWYSYRFFEAAMASSIIVLSTCGPGLGLLIPGIHMQNRSERCQTFYAMMKGRSYAKVKDLAAAVPCTYSQAAKDLRWMIHEGFFPGAYIDASKRIITYSGAEPEQEPAKKPKEQPKPEQPAKKPGFFPEVERIHQIDAEIDDEFVSEQIVVLAELTHKIFAYVEKNPEKEDRISQFRNHYLPKTIKILESYARFEKQGVKGANIRAAMKDVEEIMGTLVSGFEKQLDMLFLDEALDVTTDINVLESMMSLTGLSNDDPFKLELMGEES